MGGAKAIDPKSRFVKKIDNYGWLLRHLGGVFTHFRHFLEALVDSPNLRPVKSSYKVTIVYGLHAYQMS